MKYSVRLQTTEMEKKSKFVTVELPNNEMPTPYNIISRRLTECYIEKKEELGLKTGFDIARAVAYDAVEMMNNLIYYEVKELKEE